jgi:hypothetical protein
MYDGPFFPLAPEDQDGKKKAPSITLSQLRTLIEVVLPIKQRTVEYVLEKIIWIQTRNHRAYLSHRKRRLCELNCEG